MVLDLCAAKKWLAGTFLKVRLEDNPAHYQINGDTPDRNLGARLERICESAISELKRLELIEQGPSFKCTEYGDAMARYYMNIKTMELILSLPRKPKTLEIVRGYKIRNHPYLLTCKLVDHHITSPRVQRDSISFGRKITIQGTEQ